MDYTQFFKTRYELSDPWPDELGCDAFISAYNDTTRVKAVFAAARASKKIWAIHDEYGFREAERPAGTVFAPGPVGEAEFVVRLLQESNISPDRELVCIDTTGFMRPHILVLLRVLQQKGARRALFLYSEPQQYANREKTAFAGATIREVRPVQGFAGSHDLLGSSTDLLVLGVGYETELVKQVAYSRRGAKKMKVFGFPPLQAEFFQENLVRASLASQAVGDDAEILFAPANDPFVTADVISAMIASERRTRGVGNVYLSPLSTKPQTLGFGLYYLFECSGGSTSIVYPFSESYSRGPSTGVSHVWVYDVELPDRATG